MEAVSIGAVTNVANPSILVVSTHAGITIGCLVASVAGNAGISSEAHSAGEALSGMACETVRVIGDRTGSANSPSRSIVTCSCIANCTVISRVSSGAVVAIGSDGAGESEGAD